MAEIEAAVRDYILTAFLTGARGAVLRNDDDLLMVLDSLQMLRMLIDMEAQFSIRVDNSEMLPENLGTIEKLAAFIARKRQAAG